MLINAHKAPATPSGKILMSSTWILLMINILCWRRAFVIINKRLITHSRRGEWKIKRKTSLANDDEEISQFIYAIKGLGESSTSHVDIRKQKLSLPPNRTWMPSLAFLFCRFEGKRYEIFMFALQTMMCARFSPMFEVAPYLLLLFCATIYEARRRGGGKEFVNAGRIFISSHLVHHIERTIFHKMCFESIDWRNNFHGLIHSHII